MYYTHKIQSAIQFALEVHEVSQKQKRKGKDIPYIVHPVTVGMILARAGASEDVVAAGILHDTIEDSSTEHKATKEEIAQLFGPNVAELVASVTEENKDLSWEERKAEALAHVEHFSHDSLLVKSADVLANTAELIEDYKKVGDAVFERFNAGKARILSYQLKLMWTIITTWPENPFDDDLRSVAREFQRIGRGMFMSQYPARTIKYDEYNEDIVLECPVCIWKGRVKDAEINTDSHDVLDVACPLCEKMLLVARYT
jgi:hypothetical protein